MAKQRANPFYILLIFLGIVFVITVSAYCVMTVKLQTAESANNSAGQWLVGFMNKNGLWLMLVELALLALATFAAIATDDYWSKLAAKETTDDAQE